MELKILQTTIKDFIRDQSAASLAVHCIEGLNIYKQSYFDNLSRAIKSKYPTVVKYLGSDLKKLIHDFIVAHPSKSPNLDNYGDDFAGHLTLNNLPIAASLAQVDLEIFTCSLLYEKPLGAEKLAHIAPDDFDRLTFLLNPALRLIKVNTEYFEIWSGFNKELAISRIADQDAQEKYVAICLAGKQIILNILPASFYKACENMRENIDLLETTARALRIDPSFNLNNFLAFCFKNNLIVNFNLRA